MGGTSSQSLKANNVPKCTTSFVHYIILVDMTDACSEALSNLDALNNGHKHPS